MQSPSGFPPDGPGRSRAPAPDPLPVLNADEPEGIIRWCRYVLSQPAERAIELSRSLHAVMGSLTDEAAVAVERVLSDSSCGYAFRELSHVCWGDA